MYKQALEKIHASRWYKRHCACTQVRRSENEEPYQDTIVVVRRKDAETTHLCYVADTADFDIISPEIQSVKKVDNAYHVDMNGDQKIIRTTDTHLKGQLEEILEQE